MLKYFCKEIHYHRDRHNILQTSSKLGIFKTSFSLSYPIKDTKRSSFKWRQFEVFLYMTLYIIIFHSCFCSVSSVWRQARRGFMVYYVVKEIPLPLSITVCGSITLFHRCFLQYWRGPLSCGLGVRQSEVLLWGGGLRFLLRPV